MAGPVALQRREDAVLLRQRPEAVLPLLLLRQARRHLHLPHGDRGPVLPRSRRAARGRGGRAAAEGRPGRAGGEEAPARTLYDVMELAAAFFEAPLQGRSGAKARGYLADRGLAPRHAARFRIGYAPPERFALRDHLAGKGVAAGDDDRGRASWSPARTSQVPYDRFRDRVMFPIDDLRGRVVAFGGRALERRRAGEVPQLAGDAALPQGPAALQPPPRPQGRPRARAR